MKKAVIALIVGGIAVFIGSNLLFKYANSDSGFPIGIASGPAVEGKAPFHAVISMGMTHKEGAKLVNGVAQWFQWIDEHIDLRDSSGQKVDLQKMGFSNLVTEQQSMNPEFFVGGKIVPGQTYTFDYIPILDEKKRYRHTFTAAAEGKPFERVNCLPIE